MTNDDETQQKPRYPEIEYVVVEKPRRKWYRSPGCLLGLAVWFLMMLTPMVFIILAVQGEITLHHGPGIPERHRHPLLQVKLLMDADRRGISITNTSIAEESADELCVQTNVRYFMWQGQGDPVVYCECYMHDDPQMDWTAVSDSSGQCSQRQDEP